MFLQAISFPSCSRDNIIPTEDTDSFVVLSNGGYFSSMPFVPLGTGLVRYAFYDPLQSQYLNGMSLNCTFQHPTLLYDLLHEHS